MAIIVAVASRSARDARLPARLPPRRFQFLQQMSISRRLHPREAAAPAAWFRGARSQRKKGRRERKSYAQRSRRF